MAKRIVISCDGTWNSPDQEVDGVPCPTNVTRIALTVAPRDSNGKEQLVFYDKGVGTGAFDRLRGGAFGFGLSRKIQDCYRFLIQSYEPGDELFFFGFSRGAYTARSTVGLIRNCGLLKREHLDQFDAAYALYRRRDIASHPAGVEAQLFRKSFSFEPRVKFIGVWDTVGALGIPLDGPLRLLNYRWQFHDVQLSRMVENAFQALAIDERRRPFKPAVWEQHEAATDQVLEQVWFAGVHSNVGGGYRDSGLSDIALLWLSGKAELCGLAFDRSLLGGIVKPDPLGLIKDSQTWFYRLLGGDYVRPIGKGKISYESAASTAVSRQENPAARYSPENLESYRSRGGGTTLIREVDEMKQPSLVT
jgi:uncharacterized protein (DUF2235 family)